MCYFVAVGAAAPAWAIARVFEELADLDRRATAICPHVASSFPSGDQVRVITAHGCSCDLLDPGTSRVQPNPHARRLTQRFQRGIVALARDAGSVRLLVHRHAGQPSSRCRVPDPRACIRLEVHELMSVRPWYVENVLMEVRGRPPATAARSS